MSRNIYDKMRKRFDHKLDIDSIYKSRRRLATLAQFDGQRFDCCVNSCLCYTRGHAELDSCKFCNEARFSEDGKARRQFTYLPLIPRLRSLFQSPEMVMNLAYRAEFEYDPDTVSDVFSSQRYRTMLNTKVEVDGRPLPHTFFSDRRDIAFGLCTDGFLIFNRKRGGPSATPLLLKLYNLPPTIRTHLEHLICLGVIPGPLQPKDLGSFLAPFDDECAELAHGTNCFDCVAQELFALHAYQLTEEGDIIAIEKFLGLKGHSSICPCRSCLMRGCRMSSGSNKVYYIPVTRPPDFHGNLKQWNLDTVPKRTQLSFREALDAIDNAQTQRHRKELEQYYGVKHTPALQRVNALDYGRSCPWEWAHLFAENIIPNFLDIWTGRFKAMDMGDEDYEIDGNVWQEIGRETAMAVKNIPASFVRSLGNIAEDRSTFTAESYAFWFMYLAPHLLKNRFNDVKYYDHFVDLVKIMKLTSQLTITSMEIDELEVLCRTWVSQYER